MKATIRKLVNYGDAAGETLRDEFDLDGHRWLVFWCDGQDGETARRGRQGYRECPCGHESIWRFPQELLGRAASLQAGAIETGGDVSVERSWRQRMLPGVRSYNTRGQIPKPATNLRITPKTMKWPARQPLTKQLCRLARLSRTQPGDSHAAVGCIAPAYREPPGIAVGVDNGNARAIARLRRAPRKVKLL